MTKVIYKKLRKYWGWAYIDQNKIELYNKLRGKRHLNVLIHEKLHLLFPNLSERDINSLAKEMADLLWKDGYRKY